MKRAIAILAACLILCGITSCGAKPNEDVKVYAPEDTLTGTLEIAVISTYGYDTFVNAFTTKHPGVDIKLTSFPNPQTANTILSTKFMAGEGFDIIDLSTLPVREYADKGYLVDLSAYMEADMNFDKTAYNANVFDAMRYKGMLYTMPSAYRHDFVSINKNAPAALIEEFSQLKSISLTKMIDMYSRSGMQNDFTIYKNPSMLYAMSKDMETYIDYEAKTCSFNTPAFIEKIQLYKEAFGAVENAGNYNLLQPDALGVNRMNDGEYSAMYLFNDSRAISDSYLHMGYDELYFSPPKPLVDDNGALYARPLEVHAITSFCEDKALAWEFIKFVTSEEAQALRGAFGVPVHLVAMETLVAAELMNTLEYYNENGGPYSPIDETQFIANALAIYTGASELPISINMNIGLDASSIEVILWNELEAFATSSVTAEQAAENIQKRISIALSE